MQLVGQGKYGLIKPAGGKPAVSKKRLSAFDDGGDEAVEEELHRQAEVERGRREVRSPLKCLSSIFMQVLQTQAKAKAEDPTVFMYDEVIEEKKPLTAASVKKTLEEPVCIVPFR